MERKMKPSREMGLRLKSVRKKNGYSQENLAEELGMTTSAVGGYETGKSFPSVEVLTKISEILNVSIDWLIRGEGESDYNSESGNGTPLQQKIQQMEETFRQKEQQYLEIIKNLSLGKDEVIEYLAAVVYLATGSVTYQLVPAQKLALG